MPDEPIITIKDAADAVKGLAQAVPIYQDLLQPAVQGLGKELVLVPRMVHMALAPLRVMVWGFDRIEEYLQTSLSEKHKNTPPEHIIPPSPHVAVPAMLALSYTADEPALREMYVNLLATSMDDRTAIDAHPAFVEVIKQMTPDEARIVRLFQEGRRLPLIHMLVSAHGSEGSVSFRRNISLLGQEAGCTYPELTPTYIDNLSRLGLSEITTSIYTAEGAYDALENEPSVVLLKQTLDAAPDVKYKFERGGLRITNFGKQFVKACVIEREQQ